MYGNMYGKITQVQYATLMKPLNPSRIAERKQGGKNLSYVEAYDIRAHLIRTFGFGNFDVQMLEYRCEFVRDVEIGKDKNPGIEVAYSARVQVTVRDEAGEAIATHIEGAVGSASGSVNYGDLHDNALKTAASDAMKRCMTNWGSQFGLSLYDNGSKREIVKGTLIKPVETNTVTLSQEELALREWEPGTRFMVIPPEIQVDPVRPDETDEQTRRIAESLGATVISDDPEGNQAGEPMGSDGDREGIPEAAQG